MAEPRTRVDYYFDLSDFTHKDVFTGCEQVWDVFKRLTQYIDTHLTPAVHGTVMDGAWVGDHVYLAEGAVVEPGAMIKGPAIIGPGTVIRQGAYLREYCLIGADCVVGHTTEIKSSILLNRSQAPHFNYVGNSVLGRGVNLGAGTKLSNLKNDQSLICVTIGPHRYHTGLNKFGAIIGDAAATGCNCVTSPGTLLGPGTHVYANVVVRESVPAGSIVKLRQNIEIVERH